jgi:hypothetical protein
MNKCSARIRLGWRTLPIDVDTIHIILARSLSTLCPPGANCVNGAYVAADLDGSYVRRWYGWARGGLNDVGNGVIGTHRPPDGRPVVLSMKCHAEARWVGVS